MIHAVPLSFGCSITFIIETYLQAMNALPGRSSRVDQAVISVPPILVAIIFSFLPTITYREFSAALLQCLDF